MEANKLIGKYFEMINIDGSIMVRIRINYIKIEITPLLIHVDGSVSPSRKNVFVSENKAGWYRVYKTDRIVN